MQPMDGRRFRGMIHPLFTGGQWFSTMVEKGAL